MGEDTGVPRPVRSLLKPLATRTVLREGSVRPILWGPARGLRYRIFADYGLAPIYGGWEPSAQRLMTQLLRPGSSAYDVGANFGMHTLLMSRLVGPGGHVFAFEPVPDIADELERNLALNDLLNVSVIRQALSDQAGSTGFSLGHHRGAGRLVIDAPADLSVATTTLDDFVLGEGNVPPDFIKVDAEGAESRVLKGGDRVIRGARPAMLIETHSLAEEATVGRFLLERGYVLERVGATRRLASRPRVVNAAENWPDAESPWGYVLAMPG